MTAKDTQVVTTTEDIVFTSGKLPAGRWELEHWSHSPELWFVKPVGLITGWVLSLTGDEAAHLLDRGTTDNLLAEAREDLASDLARRNNERNA